MTGDLTLDSGSGGATLDGIHGGRLNMDVGSGRCADAPSTSLSWWQMWDRAACVSPA